MLINNRCVVSVKFSIFNLFILLDTNIYHSTIKSTACSCPPQLPWLELDSNHHHLTSTKTILCLMFIVQLVQGLVSYITKKYFCAIYNLYIFIPDMDNTCRNYFNPSI